MLDEGKRLIRSIWGEAVPSGSVPRTASGSGRRLTAGVTEVEQPIPGNFMGPSRPLVWAYVVLVAAAIGVQPVEEWVMAIHPHAAKVPSIALAALWGADLVLNRRVPRFNGASLLGMGLLCTVALSGAIHLGVPGVTLSLVRWLPFLVVFVILIDVLSTYVSPHVALGAMAVSATAAGTGAIWSFVALGETRASGPMEDPNDLAYALTAAIPILAIVFGSRGRSTLLRVFAWLGVLICGVGAAATVSRGGALAMAALVVWAVVYRRIVSPRVAVLGALAAAGAALVVWTVAGNVVIQALTEKDHIGSYNVDTRLSRWQGALRGLADEPWLGMGPGGALARYGINSSWAEMDTPTAATHNMYIEVAADLGVIGFGFFMLLIASSFVMTSFADGRDFRSEIAAEGSLVAICVSSFFLSQQYYMPLWATMAVAAACSLRRQSQAEVVLS